jgi:hypothetical protein
MSNLEDVIHDLARRGEISDLGLSMNSAGTKWRAHFAMCSKYGYSYAEDADPVKAMLMACLTAKMKPRRVIADAKIEQSIVDVKPEEDPVADLM